MFIPSDLYHEMLCHLPIVCVDVLIIHENKCLLLLRSNTPAKNQYWFPGGRILKMESIETAAKRKAFEETNLTCDFIRIVSVEQTMFEKEQGMNTDVHTINICCLLSPKDMNRIKIDHLHENYRWIDKIEDHFHEGVKNPLKIMGFQ